MDISTFSHPQLTAVDAADLLVASGFGVDEWSPVRRTLLDTFDGRLHSAGLELELRVDSDGRRLVLSSPQSLPASIAVGAPPRFIGDLPSGPFRSRLAPVVEMRALLELVTFDERVVRATDRDSHDKTVVAATVHADVTVVNVTVVDVADATVIPWVVEVAELAGHHKPADRTVEMLAERGFEPCERSLTGLVLAAAGVDPAGIVNSPMVDLDRDLPAVDGFRKVLANLADAIQTNWRGTIEDIDTEFLHELRVAIRRSRSILGQGKQIVPTDVRDSFRDELRWLALLTGPLRDLDVYILEWDRYVAQLSPEGVGHLEPVLAHLREHRARAHRELVTALRSERAHRLLADWKTALAFFHVSTDGSKRVSKPIGTVVAKRLLAAQKTVIDDGRRITIDSPAEDLHELRKKAKVLRYIVECFGGLMPAKERKAFIRQLKGLQDNLGEHQDAEVHALELRSVARELSEERSEPDTLIALGQLTEQLELAKRSARAEFAERFDAYDSKETRSILDELITALRDT